MLLQRIVESTQIQQDHGEKCLNSVTIGSMIKDFNFNQFAVDCRPNKKYQSKTILKH
jgi:hypothetical protein